MSDINSDDARAFRRNRLLKVKPMAAAVMMPEADYNTKYLGFHLVSREHQADCEERNNIMFCPSCVEELDPSTVKLRQLHVSYEDDVLGNFPLIAVVKCRGCKWEEMIPVVKAEISAEDQTLLRRFHRAQQRGDSILPHTNPAIQKSNQLFNPGLWADKIQESFAAPSIGDSVIRFGQNKATRIWVDIDKNRREARDVELARSQLSMIEQVEKEAMRQTAKQAQLSTAYGAGQQNLSNIMQQYQNIASQQMMQSGVLGADLAQIEARIIDREIMKNIADGYGLNSKQLIHDELTTFKEAPAKAAKAAHSTLVQKVAELQKKFKSR